jgi:cleavage and polyadenylation specificity factor subunit 1
MPDDLERGNYPLQIDEIIVNNLGSDPYRTYPYLIARTNKFDVFIYRIIPTSEHSIDTNGERLSIRLVRIDHNYISREPQSYADAEGDKLNPIESSSQPPSFIKKCHLVPFDRVGVESHQLYAGVVVTGARPLWIMMAHSGVREGPEFVIQEGVEDAVYQAAPLNSSNALRVHPMSVDGPLASFTQLHNINIPFGFAYINEKGLFRICQLPPHFSYDRDWAVCKIPLGRSTQKVAYHSFSETYVLATSTPTVFEIDRARYMAAVAAGVIADGEELPDAEKKVSGVQDVIEVRGL